MPRKSSLRKTRSGGGGAPAFFKHGSEVPFNAFAGGGRTDRRTEVMTSATAPAFLTATHSSFFRSTFDSIIVGVDDERPWDGEGAAADRRKGIKREEASPLRCFLPASLGPWNFFFCPYVPIYGLKPSIILQRLRTALIERASHSRHVMCTCLSSQKGNEETTDVDFLCTTPARLPALFSSPKLQTFWIFVLAESLTRSNEQRSREERRGEERRSLRCESEQCRRRRRRRRQSHAWQAASHCTLAHANDLTRTLGWDWSGAFSSFLLDERRGERCSHLN